MATDLSWLPDQEQTKKKVDLSFLPDQSEPTNPDTSFLPNPPVALPPAPVAEPRQPEATDIPGLSPSANAYKRGVDAYLDNDAATAARHAQDALRLDATNTQAQNLLNRITSRKAQGLPATPDQAPIPGAQPAKSLPKDQQPAAPTLAERATSLLKDVVPNVPLTPGAAVSAVKDQFQALPKSVPGTPEAIVQDLAKASAASGATGNLEEAGQKVRQAFHGAINNLIQTPIYVGARPTPARAATTEALMTLTGLQDPQELENLKNAGLTMLDDAADNLPLKPSEFRDWTAMEGAGIALGIIGAPVVEAVTARFPALSRDLFQKSVIFPSKDLPDLWEKAATAREDAYLKGATGPQADKIGLDLFEKEAAKSREAAISELQQHLPPEGQGPGLTTQAPGGVQAQEVMVERPFVRTIKDWISRLQRSAGELTGKAEEPVLEAGATAEPKPSLNPETVGAKAPAYVSEKFPTLAKLTSSRPFSVPKEAFTDALQAATSAGEAALIRTGNQAQADIVATMAFTREIKARQVEAPKPPETPQVTNPPHAPAPIEEAEPTPPGVRRLARPTKSEILAHARSLRAQSAQEMSPLERFVLDAGGVRSNADIKGEMADVPLHLRGHNPMDIVEQDARDAGVLGQKESLVDAIRRLPKRKARQSLGEFVPEARHQLEHEYAVYGRPKEGLKVAPGVDEIVPFEKGPEYGPKEGPPRAEFLGWQDQGSFGPPEPYYNIRGEHPRWGSTVGRETLGKLGIEIPETPSFESWKATRTGSPQPPTARESSPSFGASPSPAGEAGPGMQNLPQGRPGTPTVASSNTVFPGPKASFASSIVQHPDFVKLTDDATAVINKYAQERGVEASPEFADKIWHELHDAFGDFRLPPKGEEAAVRAKIKSQYPDLANEWLTVNAKKFADNTQGYFDLMIAGKYGSYRPTAAMELGSGYGVPSKKEVTAQELIGTDLKKSARDNFDAFMKKVVDRTRAESAGQAILDKLESEDVSPRSVHDEFFKNTYPNISEYAKKFFQKYIRRMTGGMEPGVTIGMDTIKKEPIVAKDWSEILDIPNDVNHLEGGERGLISLMYEMNRRFNDLKKTIGPALPDPTPKAKQLLLTEEGQHQVKMPIPQAIAESTVVKDLVEQGHLPASKMRIDNPQDVAAIFQFSQQMSTESFYVLSLDDNNNILGAEMVSLGTLNSTLVHPRDALKGANLLGAKKIWAVHNHPSEDPTPSTQDQDLTGQLSSAAKDLGISLEGHVVIDGDKFGLIETKGVSIQKTEKPTEQAENIRIVRPVVSRAGVAGEPIVSPATAAKYMQAVYKGQKGLIAVALDTKNRPVGVWRIGDGYALLDEMTERLGRIVVRNNASSIILSSEKMPDASYIKSLNHLMDLRWSIPVRDVLSVAPDGGHSSALQEGKLGEIETPYGAPKPLKYVDNSAMKFQPFDVTTEKGVKRTYRDIRYEYTGHVNAQKVRAQHLAQDIRKILPNKVDREALTFYRDSKETADLFAEAREAILSRALEVEDPLFVRFRQAIDKALKPTPKMLDADKMLTQYFSETGKVGREHGFLSSLVDDEKYINRIYRPEPPEKFAKTESMRTGLGKSTSHAKARFYGTLLEAMANGKEPATTDAADLLGIHGEEFARVLANNKLYEGMERAKLGYRLGVGDTRVPPGWRRLGMSNFVLPEWMEIGLRSITDPNFLNRLEGVKTFRQLQGLTKTINLSASAFHHFTMLMTSLYQGNYGAVGKIGPANLTDFMGSQDYRNMETDFVRHGGITSTLDANMDVLRELSEDNGVLARALKLPGIKQYMDFINANNRYLFGKLQPFFKVTDYGKKMSAWIAKHPGATEGEIVMAKRAISREINAAFGGLNWKALGVSPTALGISRLLLLAPDWTYSNLELFKLASDQWGSGPEAAGGKAARAHIISAIIGGLALTEGISHVLTGHGTEGNAKGHKTEIEVRPGVYLSLFRGPIGEAIKWATRIAENGLIQGSAQYAQGKLSPTFRTATGLAFNVNYYGGKIVKKNDPFLTATAKGAQFVGENMGPVPFGVSGFAQSKTKLDPISDLLILSGLARSGKPSTGQPANRNVVNREVVSK